MLISSTAWYKLQTGLDMKPKFLTIIALIFAVGILMACTQPETQEPTTDPTTVDIEPTATAESEEEADDSDAEAATGPESPLAVAKSPLPEPAQAAAPEAAPVIEAQYGDDTGAVTGLLRALHNDGDVRILVGGVIGAGELVPRDEGEGNIGVAYSPSDSPRATIADDGTFSINDLQPGEYALILDAVVTQSLMSLPDGSGDFLVTVEAGEQLDLGILEYTTLPYPGFVND